MPESVPQLDCIILFVGAFGKMVHCSFIVLQLRSTLL